MKNINSNPLEYSPLVSATADQNDLGNEVREVKDAFDRDCDITYKGINVSTIINKVLGKLGLDAEDDIPVDVAKSLCYIVRHTVGFHADKLFLAIHSTCPSISIDILEMMARKACADFDNVRGVPKTLTKCIDQLLEEMKNEGEDAKKLKMPQLPKGVKVIVDKFPPEMKPAALIVTMALYSARSSKIRACYNSNEIYHLLFLVFVLADSASGKSHLDRIKNLIIGDIVERDQKLNMLEQEQKESGDKPKARSKGKKGDGEKDDAPQHYPIQYVGSTTSITELAFRTLIAGPLPLVIYDNEAEGMMQSCLRGPMSNIWVFLRKGVEGSEYVQNHHGKDTFSGICYPHIIAVLCGQKEIVIPVLKKHIQSGVTSRAVMTTISHELGAKRPKVEDFTDEDKAFIRATALHLEQEEDAGLILPKVQKALDRWLNEKADEAIRKFNYAIDHFRKRSAQFAYIASCLYYYLDGKEETADTVKFAKYFSEYMLQEQLRYFGDEYNKQKMTGVDAKFVNNFDYYSMLPADFTTKNLEDIVRIKTGNNDVNVRMILSRWRKGGFITTDSDKTIHHKIIKK